MTSCKAFYGGRLQLPLACRRIRPFAGAKGEDSGVVLARQLLRLFSKYGADNQYTIWCWHFYSAQGPLKRLGHYHVPFAVVA